MISFANLRQAYALVSALVDLIDVRACPACRLLPQRSTGPQSE